MGRGCWSQKPFMNPKRSAPAAPKDRLPLACWIIAASSPTAAAAAAAFRTWSGKSIRPWCPNTASSARSPAIIGTKSGWANSVGAHRPVSAERQYARCRGASGSRIRSTRR
ncbi:MAG TPA: hypothetical protein DD417_17600 [Elusimicrobia bacterium]|nr:hypothetical protein [Elusimicrobiota bacterium]